MPGREKIVEPEETFVFERAGVTNVSPHRKLLVIWAAARASVVLFDPKAGDVQEFFEAPLCTRST